jgi:hypothetical protein
MPFKTVVPKQGLKTNTKKGTMILFSRQLQDYRRSTDPVKIFKNQHGPMKQIIFARYLIQN